MKWSDIKTKKGVPKKYSFSLFPVKKPLKEVLISLNPIAALMLKRGEFGTFFKISFFGIAALAVYIVCLVKGRYGYDFT